MKLVNFKTNKFTSYGCIIGDEIIDLGSRLKSELPDMIDVIRENQYDRIRELSETLTPDFNQEDIEFNIPIKTPDKIICIGVNYGNRNAEYKDGSDAPKYPSVFLRTPGSFVGHNQNILRPPESEQLDYEGEIVIVVGKGGRRIKPENFAEHIFGLTIMNEGTIRDWVRHAKFNVTQGKNFAKSASIGPWIVTADEFNNYDNLSIETRVNGEIRQNDSISNMIFKFPYLLSYLSTFFELKPGDIIATGTPVGAGARFDPPIWLKPDDVIEVHVPSIGTLKNSVKDESIMG